MNVMEGVPRHFFAWKHNLNTCIFKIFENDLEDCLLKTFLNGSDTEEIYNYVILNSQIQMNIRFNLNPFRDVYVIMQFKLLFMMNEDQVKEDNK